MLELQITHKGKNKGGCRDEAPRILFSLNSPHNFQIVIDR